MQLHIQDCFSPKATIYLYVNWHRDLARRNINFWLCRATNIYKYLSLCKLTLGECSAFAIISHFTGMRCPDLHVPYNGALSCDKLAFGVYCVPHCERGLQRLLPDHIRYPPRDYVCSTQGKWLPHDIIGDCSSKS